MGMCKPSDTFALTETHPTTVGLDTRYEGKLPHEFTSEDLAKFYHLPINDAAEKLGICSTLLKKLCRKNGISRWPHRKVKSVEQLIQQCEDHLNEYPNDQLVQQQLSELQDKMKILRSNPNVSFSKLLPKHTRKISHNDKALLKPTKTITKDKKIKSKPIVHLSKEKIFLPSIERLLKESSEGSESPSPSPPPSPFPQSSPVHNESELIVQPGQGASDEELFQFLYKSTPIQTFSRISFVGA